MHNPIRNWWENPCEDKPIHGRDTKMQGISINRLHIFSILSCHMCFVCFFNRSKSEVTLGITMVLVISFMICLVYPSRRRLILLHLKEPFDCIFYRGWLECLNVSCIGGQWELQKQPILVWYIPWPYFVPIGIPDFHNIINSNFYLYNIISNC